MYLLLAVPISILGILLFNRLSKSQAAFLPYIFFFVGPILSYFGVIGILTGFDGSGLGGITFGITFYTIFIAYQLSRFGDIAQKSPLRFLLSAINPIYLFTGPVPNIIIEKTNQFKYRNLIRRFSAINSDLLLGLFFSAILAPSLRPYFYLKNSTQIVDILLFGVAFELYVYFNFCGFSMIAWSAMRLVGIKVTRNFKQPFGANSIVQYWQRWHISLSNILKQLFFSKSRHLVGVYGSVVCVFFASAFWHGVSQNFVLWGLFHSVAWCSAHYFHKLGFRFLNYILLIIGVVVGRVIFSELDWNMLTIKLMAIVDFSNWRLKSDFVVVTTGIRETLNLSMAFLVVILEMVLPHMGYADKDYRHLRSPNISTLIAVYMCLAFIGFNGAPIYGNR